MTVSGVLAVNLIWSVLMLCAFTALAVGGPNPARGPLLLLGVGNLAIAILAMRRNRWAITGAILVAALVAARWTPMVLYNWWAFFNHLREPSDRCFCRRPLVLPSTSDVQAG